MKTILSFFQNLTIESVTDYVELIFRTTKKIIFDLFGIKFKDGKLNLKELDYVIIILQVLLLILNMFTMHGPYALGYITITGHILHLVLTFFVAVPIIGAVIGFTISPIHVPDNYIQTKNYTITEMLLGGLRNLFFNKVHLGLLILASSIIGVVSSLILTIGIFMFFSAIFYTLDTSGTKKKMAWVIETKPSVNEWVRVLK